MMYKNWKSLLAIVVVMGLMLGCVGSTADAGGGSSVPQTSVLTSVGSGAESTLAHTISVTGLGTATARPDVAYVTLGVDIMDQDIAEALSASATRMNAVREALDAYELAPEDLQTVQYNVWVEQIYNERGEPTGEYRYHVVNQLRIRLHDIDDVAPILTAALDAGANSVGGINFEVEDTAAMESQARDLAIANAQAKAEQLAAGFGATVVGLNQVAEVSSGGGVVARMATDVAYGVGGGGAGPVEAGEYSVSVQLAVVFDIE